MHRKLHKRLEQLRQTGGYRVGRPFAATGYHVTDNAEKLVNFSSNDYLGLTGDPDLQHEFFKQAGINKRNWMSSSSARPLTGTSTAHAELEKQIARRYQKSAALLFNSGYHANTGILPAITDRQDLILADKLVHASLIDGLSLGAATCKRFAHNNIAHLTQLLEKFAQDFDNIWIVTESVFSMDGDIAPLAELVQLKKRFNAYLYVDEAHAVGSLGQQGLGLAVEQNVGHDIDLIVGTFGKSLAGYGGFVTGDQIVIDAITNFARSWLFSTAVPPINIDWNLFIWQQLADFAPQRKQLSQLTTLFKQQLSDAQQDYLGETNIVPLLQPGNSQVLALAQALSQQGILALPIRSPTVAKGAERIRFSLTANIPETEIERCVQALISISSTA